MTTKYSLIGLMIAASILGGCSDSNNNNDDDNASADNGTATGGLPNTAPGQQAQQWFEDGRNTVASAQQRSFNNNAGAAKNVILFVGDGMSVTTVTAARILAGQRDGEDGEAHQLSFEKFPGAALSKTYDTNAQTPDSAGTMTAMVTGVKSKMGVLSVGPDTLRGNCASSKGNELVTALQLAEMQGMATGVVSTARLTHATPAATYAHTPERNWESNDELTDEARNNGCLDIADQFIQFDDGDGIDVAFGGGRRHFLPEGTTDLEGQSGRRTDGRDLTQEWRNAHPDGVYVQDEAGFEAIDAAASGPILGLFNSSHMQYEADKDDDIAGEPTLPEMTAKALAKVQQDPDGYFMMVEGGRIDHAHHAGSAYNALDETVEFAKAIRETVANVDLGDTLIIVTADHGHTFKLAGYPTRGNPILGKVVGNDSSGTSTGEATLAADDLPYTTLNYMNGLGFADLGGETDADTRYAVPPNAGRMDLTAVDTTTSGFHQEALVPLGAETHSGTDVGIYATGPDAQLLNGTIEQNVIFHVMNRAAGLVSGANASQ